MASSPTPTPSSCARSATTHQGEELLDRGDGLRQTRTHGDQEGGAMPGGAGHLERPSAPTSDLSTATPGRVDAHRARTRRGDRHRRRAVKGKFSYSTTNTARSRTAHRHAAWKPRTARQHDRDVRPHQLRAGEEVLRAPPRISPPSSCSRALAAWLPGGRLASRPAPTATTAPITALQRRQGRAVERTRRGR